MLIFPEKEGAKKKTQVKVNLEAVKYEYRSLCYREK